MQHHTQRTSPSLSSRHQHRNHHNNPPTHLPPLLATPQVWTDYPGSPAARKALVNDLDLTVRAEGYNGMPLLGNGGSISDSSSPDR